MAYDKRTRQGYKVEQVFLDEGTFPVVLALIKRKNDWMWAFAYHFEDGTWGQGHYDFDTKEDALKDLLYCYRRARPVDAKGIIRVETDDGSFGKFTKVGKALARAYVVAKERDQEVYLVSYDGKRRLGEVAFLDGRCNFFSPTGRYVVYSDGYTKKIL